MAIPAARVEGLLRDVVAELRALRGEVRRMRIGDDSEGPACPACFQTDVTDSSVAGQPRLTCMACGVSFTPPPQEVSRG